MNETLKNLIERRSIKKYKNDKIDTGLLNQILEAGTYAANGRGIQGTSIVAIQNAELVKKLEIMNAKVIGNPDAKPFYNAQVFESEEGRKLAREWGVDDKYAGIGFCILGYRDCDFPSPKPRKNDFVRIIL